MNIIIEGQNPRFESVFMRNEYSIANSVILAIIVRKFIISEILEIGCFKEHGFGEKEGE